MALIKCTSCGGSGKVKNPNQQPKAKKELFEKKSKGSISSGNGPKNTHLDARSKEEKLSDLKKKKQK